MMWAPDPLLRHRIPIYHLLIPSLRSCARLMILRAAPCGITILDILHAGGSEGVWEYAFRDAVSATCSHDV